MKERNPIRTYIGKQYNHNWNFAHFYPQSSIIYQYRFTIKYNLLSHTFFLNIKNIIFTGTYISYIRLSPLVFSFLSNVLFDIVRRLIRKSYFHLRESFRRHFYQLYIYLFVYNVFSMTTLRGYNPRAFLHFSGEVIICISFGYDIHQCFPPFINEPTRIV